MWSALVVGGVLVCGACAGSPDLESDRAGALQESVLAVTQAAEQARWSDAQTLLDETRTTLDAGADAGDVSTARYREIDAALDQVAADLAAEQAAAEQAAAQQAAAEQAAAEQAAAEQAAAEQAAADAAAAEDDEDDGPGRADPKDKVKPPGKKDD